MKALTLRHPWAYAITRLGKDIENRTWKPTWAQLAHGDYLAIHGGAHPKNGNFDEFARDLCSLDEVFPRDFPAEQTILCGIVAVCRFDGWVTKHDSLWFNGPIGWVLKDTVALPESIPCKGQQGLWDVPEDAYKLIRRGYKEATRP